MMDSRELRSLSHLYDRAGLVVLPVAGLAMMLALLPLGASTFDMSRFFVPWMNMVNKSGLTGISGEFADYTPPYIYLMYLASGLVPLIGTIASIKVISVPFVGISAIGIYHLILQVTKDKRRALLAAFTLCVAPTVQVNAFLWGQADNIYTSFLVLFTCFTCLRRPLLAVLMFGVALSFKLQAMFLSPFLLYMVLSGQVRIWTLLAIPLVYVAMMTPAALAGRPWLDLLTVYVNQGHAFQTLSMSAPNPWMPIQRWNLLSYRTGIIIGMPLAAAVGLTIAVGAMRLRVSARTNLLVATTCAAVMPYVLPKMHERYFFVADILSLTLAFASPRYWSAAILFQIGSLVAYLSYFDAPTRGPLLGIIPVTCAIGIIFLCHLESEAPNRIDRTIMLQRIRDAVRFRAARPSFT